VAQSAVARPVRSIAALYLSFPDCLQTALAASWSQTVGENSVTDTLPFQTLAAPFFPESSLFCILSALSFHIRQTTVLAYIALLMRQTHKLAEAARSGLFPAQ
jgi:hypothetical protein